MIPSGFREQVLEVFREESRELLQQTENVLQSLGDRPEKSVEDALVFELKRLLHTLKGAASAVGEEAFAEATHHWEDALLSAAQNTTWTILESLDDCYQRLENLQSMIGQENIQESELESVPDTAEPQTIPKEGTVERTNASRDSELAPIVLSEYLRVKTERIDNLDALLGDLTVLRLQDEQAASRLNTTRKLLSKSMTGFRQLTTALRKIKREAPSDTLNTFTQNFEKMGAQLNAAFKECFALSREIPVNLDQERALISNIEDNVRALRLMPLQSFFEEYQKVVRQAARQCDKLVKLKIISKGAEVDRPVLVKLRDPLLHLIRNAVVHGIETPTERRLAGKPEFGTILLEGICEGGRATIRVSDDGAGLNEKKIAQRAQQLNLIEEQTELNKQSVLDLLTSPGFSTRGQSDVLAGRGIGLDVVGARLRELDGFLDVDSLQGLGCSFSMNVPVSTSSNVGLILSCADQQFCIVLDHIECVIRVQASELYSIEGREVVNVNDRSVAIIALSEILGIGAFSFKNMKKTAVVLKLGERRLALLVDDIPGEQTMVIKPLGVAFEGVPMFMGGAIQSDHQILPVVQVTELFRKASGAQNSHLGLASDSLHDERKKAVLVVDDSITMRTLERNILQAAGYQVTVAHDGQHALDILNSQVHFDALVTDVQMPRLDGIELCSKVRESQTPDLPIVVVTSVDNSEEQKRALNAGADAYIVKSQFEQNSFLQCISRLLGSTD
ncbi:MAG: response regulator [Planctomycetota bacterium]|nr:response regulator [Planctomycetota bacterium]